MQVLEKVTERVTEPWKGGEAEVANTFKGMLAMSRWHVVSAHLMILPYQGFYALDESLCEAAQLPCLQLAVRVYTDSQGVILNRFQGVQV